MSATDVRFTRRELRDELAWGDTQLKVHLARLVEMEFVAVHRRGLTHAYELLYESDDDGQRARLCVLREADALTPVHDYDSDRSGSKAARSAPGRGLVGPRSAPGRTPVSGQQTQQRRGLQPDAGSVNGHEHAETHVQGAPVVVSMPVVLAPDA